MNTKYFTKYTKDIQLLIEYFDFFLPGKSQSIKPVIGPSEINDILHHVLWYFCPDRSIIKRHFRPLTETSSHIRDCLAELT